MVKEVYVKWNMSSFHSSDVSSLNAVNATKPKTSKGTMSLTTDHDRNMCNMIAICVCRYACKCMDITLIRHLRNIFSIRVAMLTTLPEILIISATLCSASSFPLGWAIRPLFRWNVCKLRHWTVWAYLRFEGFIYFILYKKYAKKQSISIINCIVFRYL